MGRRGGGGLGLFGLLFCFIPLIGVLTGICGVILKKGFFSFGGGGASKLGRGGSSEQ